MQIKLNLIVETHTKNNIYIVWNEGIPSIVPDGDLKLCVAKLLKEMTKIDINPYEDWITLELADTYYKKDEETAYILFVCRIPEKIELNNPYIWTEYSKVKEILDNIKGIL